MQRFKSWKRGGLVVLVIAVAAGTFGIVSVVNAATGHPIGDVWTGNGEVSSNNSDGVTLASVSVPGASNYLVTFTGWAAGLTPGLKDVRCYINAVNGNAADTFLAVGEDTVSESGQQSFAISEVVTVPTINGHVITGNCLDSAPVGEVLYGGQITALKVGFATGPTYAPTKGAHTGPATPSH